MSLKDGWPHVLTESLDAARSDFAGGALGQWVGDWSSIWQAALNPKRHGDWPAWAALLDALPVLSERQVALDRPAVTVIADLPPEEKHRLESLLRGLHPWRKGPYVLCDIEIETEWRSDLKWDRLEGALSPLAGRTVLDVGCGSGYHLWRMRGMGARRVLGVEPSLLSVCQFLAVRHLIGPAPVHILPLTMEAVPPGLGAFDTVFSMGVLYHRRSPLEHLLELKGCLRAGGELVLETLVIEGDEHAVLVPEDRYAMMRNVWFIPSTDLLRRWLRRVGFRKVRLVDVTQTTPREQRSTAWMTFQSLADFLDPNDPAKTIEGYPAPRRAVLVAEVP